MKAIKLFFKAYFFISFLGNLLGNAEVLGQDRALFIAVDEYDHWTPLNNPVNDAESIAAVLKDIYGYQTEILKNPSKLNIFNKLEAYRKKTYRDDAQLFIFFSGHGAFTENTSEGFFIPKEGALEDPFGVSFIQHARLERAIDNIPCKHILLAIDACFSGTFDEAIALMKGNMKRPGETTQVNKEVFIKRSLRVKSRLYVTSGGKERTPDGIRFSPFTEKFIAALGSYGGDDNILSYYELLSYMEHAKPLPRTGQFGDHQINGGFLFIVRNADYIVSNTKEGEVPPGKNPEPTKPTVIEQEPDSKDLELQKDGLNALENNNLIEAESIFLDLYKRGIRPALVYEGLYKIYSKKNEELALKYLQEGLQKHPDDLGLVFIEINQLLAKGRNNEVTEKLKAAIVLEPNNATLYKTLGLLYDELFQDASGKNEMIMRAQYFKDAEKYYNKALEIDQEGVDINYSFGALYYNAAAYVSKELNKLADDFSKEGMKNYESKKQEMLAYFDQALPYFKKVESLDPNNQNTLIALKEIYAKKEDLYTANIFKERLNRVRNGEKLKDSHFKN